LCNGIDFGDKKAQIVLGAAQPSLRTELLSHSPSTRGFALSLFGIEQYGGLDKVSIIRFKENFLSSAMLEPV
jgi:hypothetical protein